MKDDFMNVDFIPRSGKKMIIDFMNGTWANPDDFIPDNFNDFVIVWVDESMTDQQIDDYIFSIYSYFVPF